MIRNVFCVLACIFIRGTATRASDELQVHEWGTFTALQNEHGEALPGINIDDEPLPAFCHNLHRWVLQSPHSVPAVMMKGVPERHPYVTLRLETPVLYFHPATDEKLPFSVDVDVQFHGGWLTEFYPQARPDEPGLARNEFNFGQITPETIGSLAWHGVQVGGNVDGPQTDRHVWLAPREVAAASVSVPPQTDKDEGTESERFLFYRGVGNRPVPLRVSEDLASRTLTARAQCADVLREGESCRIDALWLVHILKDGRVAFRTIDAMNLSDDSTSVLATLPASFAENKYSPANLDAVKAKMHAALISQGLNPDEATAMLETWRHAYFQSPGLRLFFLVPRRWSDAVLPLKISRPAEVHRVMMGRIELISPEQRRLLKKLAQMEVSDGSWFRHITDSPAAQRFYQGRSDFGDLGVQIPDDYQTYLDLGRFRNALVLAEQRTRPNANLNQFINTYGLTPYQVN